MRIFLLCVLIPSVCLLIVTGTFNCESPVRRGYIIVADGTRIDCDRFTAEPGTVGDNRIIVTAYRSGNIPTWSGLVTNFTAVEKK